MIKTKKLFVAAIFAIFIFNSASYSLYQIPLQKISLKPVKINIYKKDDLSLISEEIITSQILNNRLIVSTVDNRRDKNETTKSKITYNISKDKKITVLSSLGETTRDNAPYSTFNIDFNWENNEAYFTTTKDGKRLSKTIKLTPKTVLSQSSAFYMGYIISLGKKEDSFTMIIPSGDTFNFFAKTNYSISTVEVGGNDIPCYKIDLKPDLGLLSSVIPSSAFYFTANPPYSFVRYEGLERGPSSPNVIQQITQ